MQLNPKRALVVLSGGQDSTTCLYWAIAQGFEVHAVTFDYRQRHRRELDAARTVAQMAGIGDRHEIVSVGDILKGSSPLTAHDQPLETYADHDSMAATIGDRVELTFVPMRNAFFLMLAANRAVCLGAGNLVTGVCQGDNANYPDCRSSFVHSAEGTINEALGLYDRPGTELRVLTPLMDLSKAQTVHLADALPGCMEALAYSHTAYSGEFPPVTQDHATVLRAHGFAEAGVPDPLILRAVREGLMALPSTANYDQFRGSLYRHD